MARLAILEYPDPRLHVPAEPVVDFDAALARLVDDLFETLYATTGIGLSAPQVGVARQVSVMDLSSERSEPQVFVNPSVTARARWGLVEESCLSVPGVVANVVRATRVTVHALDRDGEPFERALEDMHAVCLQHEADHLAGKLFIDRLSLPRRLHARARARAHARKTATDDTTPRAESA